MLYKLMATEGLVCLAGIVMLILEIIGIRNRRIIAWTGIGFLLAAGAAGAYNWGASYRLLGGAFIIDPTTLFFKELALIITIVALLISMDYVTDRIRRAGEFFTVMVFVCLGMLFLISSGDLVTVFVSLELTSMPMYVLAASLIYNQKSSEAGLKFFLLGALASALYLMGAALLFGSLGTTQLDRFAVQISALNGPPYAALLGMLLVISAFGFKIAAAPFHMWAPDVYQGAPTPASAFLSTGPKVAGVAILMRILLGSLDVSSPFHVRQDWVLVISVLAVLSMWVGNLVAMHQTNIKRLMAYSGISHMGYILVGLAAGSIKGSAAVMFYIFLYTLTTLGAWAVVLVFSKATGSEEIQDMAGLSRRAPGVALLLLVAFLSLAGMPPLAGFVGKFYLFAAAWEAGLRWLAVMGLLASVASLYYYLGVLKVVYFQPAPTEEGLPVSFPMGLAFGISAFAIVVLGLVPQMTTWAVRVATTFAPRG